MAAAVTDAYIKPIDFIEESSDVRSGPQPVLEQAAGLIAKMTSGYDERLIGIRVGLPGPVRFRDGAPIATPIMPGWDGYPVRDALSESLEVPVTVDNDVNIMALGEQHRDVARGISDFLFVKIGTGIGSGIICRGKIHRGADGCAGDIGHIAVSSSNTLCHCGRLGCLESEFSGVALAAKALSAAQLDAAPFLAQALIDRGRVTAEDVALGSSTGDATSVGLIREGGELLGQLLAGLVNFFNPSMIVMGGGLASFGHPLIAAVRSAIFRRSAPLATSNLSIVRSQLGAQVGVIGAAFLASEAFLNGSDWVVRCLNKVKV
jgi:predicted NBD/HSP70 family sugar kinase